MRRSVARVVRTRQEIGLVLCDGPDDGLCVLLGNVELVEALLKERDGALYVFGFERDVQVCLPDGGRVVRLGPTGGLTKEVGLSPPERLRVRVLEERPSSSSSSNLS